MSFYSENPDTKHLRFGDIVDGFACVYSAIDRFPDVIGDIEWSIRVRRTRLMAVMTPCCSIEKKAMLVAPLVPLNQSLLKNPYFAEDLTRINFRMTAKQSLAPAAWDNMPSEEKQRREALGPAYALKDLFVYAESSIFQPYPVKQGGDQREIAHYGVDFKMISRVESAMIERSQDVHPKMKLLQLSTSARHALREKCSDFFGRIPDEDNDAA